MRIFLSYLEKVLDRPDEENKKAIVDT